MEVRPNEIFENCTSPDGKLSDLPSSAGLVLFTDSLNSPILLLSAANIRRTVKNKLAEQTEKTKRADLKTITAKIYYKVHPCRFRLSLEHLQAAKKLFPSSYKDHIILTLPWFIRVDLSEKIPFFSTTKKPFSSKEEQILGPFPTQKAAAVFLNTLEDTFRLCKKNEFVNNPTRAKSCPYLQMDACSGVCAGKISLEDYQIIIKDAFEAGAKPAKQIEKLQADMQTASKELSFEKATEIKRKIEKLSVLKKQTYRWTGDLENLKIVHIDKSARIKPENGKKKIQTYVVFVMNLFKVFDLGDFIIDEFGKVTEAIESALTRLSTSLEDVGDSIDILEQFAIVSYFLYRTKPSGLWISVSEAFNKAAFEKMVREKFKL